ncbi:NAD(P)/FAD-dependent oxidoreductase [Paenibacillus ehimensis]|uniref:NAD(P)/FAD-dependent oxidoreductase n=1 Tax=Paenibacillus ehimensis TaxID=79264 RepID=UPI002DBA0908|nr:NAD(P)/FAD-dependent oxidoreductase [Paenibacillus ehimensis]MEC0210941.1 NAD(P)/FAD-dependent oxidoreductase [Paenibacillus ehimensis]
MQIDTDVLIVGAGIAGATLALAMGRKGYNVTLIDRLKRFQNIPKGDFLQPVTIDILNGLGVLPDISRHCATVTKVNYGTIGGVKCFTGNYADLDMPVKYALNGEHRKIHEGVINAATALPNVRFYPGVNAEKLVYANGRVAGVMAGSDEGTVTITCKVLVGSDGIKSKIREQLALKYNLYPYEEKKAKMFVFTLHTAIPPEAEASFYFGQGVSCGAFPLPDNRVRVYLALRKDLWQKIKDEGIEALQALLHSLYPRLKDEVAQIADFKQVQSVPAFYLHTPKWAVDGAVLLGDACHALSPALGQGMNLAIQGAMELAGTLEAALSTGDYSENTLRSYEKKRRKYVRLIQQNSTAHTFCWFVKNAAFVKMRNAAFRRMGNCPNLLKEQMLTTSGYSDKPPSFSHLLRFAGLMKP